MARDDHALDDFDAGQSHKARTVGGRTDGEAKQVEGAGVTAADLEEASRDPMAATKAQDPRQVSVVLFDLDNTLVDFLRVKRLASGECARAMIAAGADFGEPVEDVAQMLFSHYLNHGIESDDAFQTFLRKYQRNKFRYTQNQLDRVLAAGINAYLRVKETLMVPYAGVPRTLTELVRRGYRLGVVTDAPRLKAWQRLWGVGLAEYFEVVVTRTDSGAQKPDTKGFSTALEALEVPAHRSAMVGDWPARDIVGGNRLGLYTVLAQYGADGHEDLERPPVTDKSPGDDHTPDAEIHHFEDLLLLFTDRRVKS